MFATNYWPYLSLWALWRTEVTSSLFFIKYIFLCDSLFSPLIVSSFILVTITSFYLSWVLFNFSSATIKICKFSLDSWVRIRPYTLPVQLLFHLYFLLSHWVAFSDKVGIKSQLGLAGWLPRSLWTLEMEHRCYLLTRREGSFSFVKLVCLGIVHQCADVGPLIFLNWVKMHII